MQNRIVFTLFFGIFFLKASIVYSQQKDIYNFSADKLTYSQDNNIIEATGNVVAPSFYRTLTTQAIPYTTWTTVFDMNSIAGIFLFSVQLDGQDAAEWAASGIVMSTGATSGVTAQYIGTQNDGTYVQTRISGTTFQAFQNGTGPSVTMNVRVFKIG